MLKLALQCVLMLALAHTSLLSAQQVTAGPVAIDRGLLDLSAWDTAAQPSFKLSGQWRFFPGQHITPQQLSSNDEQAVPITVPGSWNALVTDSGLLTSGHGIGTYALAISGAVPGSIANIRLKHACSNARVFFFPAGNPGNQPVQTIGNPSSDPQHSIPSAANTIIPLQFTHNGLHQLLIQVSNFDTQIGGLCTELMFGTSNAIANQTSLSTATISMLAAMITMMALYLAAICIKYRQDTSSFWLAISCFSVACYFIAASGLLEMIFDSGANWVYALRYKACLITNGFAVTTIMTYYCSNFKGFINPTLLKINLWLTISYSLLCIIAPTSIVSLLYPILLGYWCLQFSSGLWVLFRAARDQCSYAITMIIAILPIIFVTPILIKNNITLIDAPLPLVCALVFFVFIQTQVIGSRFAKVYQLAERLSLNLKGEVALQTAELNEQNNKLAYAQKALQTANTTLKKLSITDGLTRIYNRMYFEEEFRKEWRRCSRRDLPISVLMIDVDNFKQLNDSAGHLAGDQCLQAISKTLQQHFKRAGELIARYGGEEFVAMLPDTDQRKALAIAEGLRAAIEKIVFEHNQQSYRVTVSIGISTTIPNSNNSTDNLLEAADAALYEAKNKGRNRVALIPMLSGRQPQRRHN